eukprot:1089109-Rhodomonas_salina.1
MDLVLFSRVMGKFLLLNFSLTANSLRKPQNWGTEIPPGVGEGAKNFKKRKLQALKCECTSCVFTRWHRTELLTVCPVMTMAIMFSSVRGDAGQQEHHPPSWTR